VKIDTAQTGLSSLIYANRWGGTEREYAYAVAVDSGGNAYIAGDTDVNGTSARQVLVVKFDPSGGQVYAKTFGGSNDSSGYGIAVDSLGNAYVTGYTGASDFPVTAGAFQTVFQGPTYTLCDAFVAKLDPTGATLLYSTFLGGNTSTDIGHAIAIDSAGNAYIAGEAYSSNFPITPDAIQPARAGTNGDAFVTVLNSTGTALLYSSYLGGTGTIAGGDKVFGIALDGNEDLVVVGQTDSTDFPLKDAIPVPSGGQFNGFVTKITNAPPVSPPAAPANLSAAAVSSSQINLTWTDQSTDETGFQIERKTGAGGIYAQIGTPAANATTYSNSGLAGGTTYYYRVRAVNGAANSAYSNEANATTPSSVSPPAAPANLSAAAVSGSQINLTWTDQSTDETGFQIERKTGAGGIYAQIGTATANSPTYSNSGLAEGTTYYYRVRAVNGAGNSAYSNEANATTSSSATSGGSSGGGGGGCSIPPEGKSKGESPLGTILALLSPGIFLTVRKTIHRKQIIP
jgi:hypothetical protein